MIILMLGSVKQYVSRFLLGSWFKEITLDDLKVQIQRLDRYYTFIYLNYLDPESFTVIDVTLLFYWYVFNPSGKFLMLIFFYLL